jgi:Secretion system C-terminal sorting domain
MKQLYTLSILLFFISGLNAQLTSFEIRDANNNTLITNGGIYYKSTTAYSNEVFIYTIKNITASSQTYNFTKIDVQMNKIGPADSAFAYFCTGILCFGSTTYTSNVTLTAGEVMTLRFDLEEASAAGLSIVKYGIKNANSSETFSVTFQYNNPLGLRDNFNLQFSSTGIYPNPGLDNLYLNIISKDPETIHYSIVNILGETVANASSSLEAGENVLKLDTELLESGIYYLRMFGQSQLPAQKFVVLK